ncbi:hypothetical protein EJ03DRAFT_348086 [Teratosphaeria nubilosa]|uniref:Uncharacterized protein n=1 Tax=Teratosphaeria nubilosa TaxID=161662 RepID=A0A6G1LJI3_9PEZI|nr:hypothetical protein EJ03DRAFT_348086 [Teratosphaeria nubilosa]
MDFSNNLALVVIIVSLIALVIAIGHMLQEKDIEDAKAQLSAHGRTSSLSPAEHSLVERKGDLAPLETVLAQLSIGRQAQAVLTEEGSLASLQNATSNTRHVLNEMEYDHLASSHLWLILSPHILGEGRKALYGRLKKNVEQAGAGAETLSRQALEYMTYVQDRYWGNFYCVWHKAVSGQADHTACNNALREIHDDTTEVSRKAPVSYVYPQLLGAHLTMATDVGLSARTRLQGKDQARVETRVADTQAVVPYISEIAHQYVDNLDRVVQLMQEQFSDLPHAMIKGLWWMMLRGIVWSMSVNITRQPLVPSYLYYSATPV